MLSSEDNVELLAERGSNGHQGNGAQAGVEAKSDLGALLERLNAVAEGMGEKARGAAGAYDPIPKELVVERIGIWILTAIFGIIAAGVADILICVWPDPIAANAAPVLTPTKITILWGMKDVLLTPNDRMLLVAMMSGVLGALVHTMTSFADFAGNKRLSHAWLPWYLLRPFIGMALAFFFYVVARTGMLTAATSPAEMNAFGVAAIAGLAGMFSKQATDKLNETFTTLFKTAKGQGDDTRTTKLAPDAPTKPVPTSTSGAVPKKEGTTT